MSTMRGGANRIWPEPHHVSFEALKFTPKALQVGPVLEREVPDVEDIPKLMAAVLVRLFHITSDDPRNFWILYHRFSRGKTFEQIAMLPGLKGLTADTIRRRFERMARLSSTKSPPRRLSRRHGDGSLVSLTG